MKLTVARRRAFGTYVREVADRVGLRDWHLDLCYGSPTLSRPDYAQDDFTAICEPTEGRRHAVITFSAEIVASAEASVDREWLRQTVVHELVHLHLSALTSTVRRDLCDRLASDAYHLFERGFTRHLEHGIDAIAYAWAEELPLPPPP